jgi:hypothetical protein
MLSDFQRLLYFFLIVSVVTHLDKALRTYVPFLKLADMIHRTAKNTTRPIALQNDMISANQYFNRIPFIHLVPFAQRLGQHNSSKLIYFPYNACRLHLLIHLSFAQKKRIALDKLRLVWLTSLRLLVLLLFVKYVKNPAIDNPRSDLSDYFNPGKPV